MKREELGSELIDARAMVMGAMSLLEETVPEHRSEEEFSALMLLRRTNAILIEALEVA